jgi:F420-non-reducing hydrogenase iron-sulfur subunit
LNPERLRIEFMSGADGGLLVDVTNDFTRQVKGLGPIGKGEGIDLDVLNFRIDAARKLVPTSNWWNGNASEYPKKRRKRITNFSPARNLTSFLMNWWVINWRSARS